MYLLSYMDYQEEGPVYEVLRKYECSDDGDSPLTREQYHGSWRSV